MDNEAKERTYGPRLLKMAKRVGDPRIIDMVGELNAPIEEILADGTEVVDLRGQVAIRDSENIPTGQFREKTDGEILYDLDTQWRNQRKFISGPIVPRVGIPEGPERRERLIERANLMAEHIYKEK